MAENTVETINLRALVGHREFVRAADTLEDVQARFAAGHQDFLAVLEGRTLLGLCSRRDVGMLLGARYGFALHGRAPVAGHLSVQALTVAVTEPLTAVLQAVAARRDEHFYDDVLLVDAAGDFLGLLHVRDLVRLQTSLLMGNLDELAARNRQMEDDLRMAREVQLALLPREFPVCRAPDGTALEFAQRYAPAGGVSGDCFDVIPLGSAAVGLLVCDVMGHGVRSALVTAMVRTVVEEVRGRAGDPAALLTEVNAHLSRLLQRAGDLIFVTAAYAVVDAASRRLTYAQAGHPAPLLFREGTGAVVALPGAEAIGGPALGLVNDAAYEALTLELAPGDRLLLFTDGIFDVANEAGQEFGRDRLAAAFATARGVALDAALGTITAAATDFAGGQPFADDVCLVGCGLRA